MDSSTLLPPTGFHITSKKKKQTHLATIPDPVLPQSRSDLPASGSAACRQHNRGPVAQAILASQVVPLRPCNIKDWTVRNPSRLKYIKSNDKYANNML